MSAALEEITEKALRLSRQEKLALANRLLSDDEDRDASEIEAAWEDEILARIQAIDEGTAVGVPYEDVIRAARNRRAK
jgi:putative addiction module component (TIGR02574 family)